MNKADKYYIENLVKILKNGTMDENPRGKYSDGTPAHSKYITQVFETYDLSENEYPITTLRNTAIKTGIKEILWIYQKQSNSLLLANEMGINWWDSWDIGNGTIGQRYGATVRKHDLIDELLFNLINDPFSRRHIINLYQYDDLNETDGLHPCAYEVLFSVRKKNNIYYLDMTLNQRSCDYLVAGYINKIQYVALQMMIANHCGYNVGKFCHFVQNLHIYDRHLDAAYEVIGNNNNIDVATESPKITLNCDRKNFYNFNVDDFDFTIPKNIPKLKNKLELAI